MWHFRKVSMSTKSFTRLLMSTASTYLTKQSVSVCCVPSLQSGVWSQLRVGRCGFKFTLSSQPLTPSREGPFTCVVWLTKHQNGAPQICVACLHSCFLNQNKEGSSDTLKALPGSSIIQPFVFGMVSMGNPAPLLADDYCWLLVALGRKEGGGEEQWGLDIYLSFLIPLLHDYQCF